MRPKEEAEDGSMAYQEVIDNVKISQLLKDVQTKYIKNGAFEQAILDNEYSKQVHDNTCDYNPFREPAYYMQGEDEEREEEKEREKEEIKKQIEE